jgi:hypothetical protein
MSVCKKKDVKICKVVFAVIIIFHIMIIDSYVNNLLTFYRFMIMLFFISYLIKILLSQLESPYGYESFIRESDKNLMTKLIAITNASFFIASTFIICYEALSNIQIHFFLKLLLWILLLPIIFFINGHAAERLYIHTINFHIIIFFHVKNKIIDLFKKQ